MENIKYKLDISKEKLEDLIQLTEESDVSRTVARAVSLYYNILKWQSSNYKLGMMPVTEDGEDFDYSRKVVILEIDSL